VGRAYLVTPDIAVKAARHNRIRRPAKNPLPDDLVLGGKNVKLRMLGALVIAWELAEKKLGPRVEGVWNVLDGGFGVRRCLPDTLFIVEGPPSKDGRLPDWGDLCNRTRVPVEGEPGLFELVEGEEGADGEIPTK